MTAARDRPQSGYRKKSKQVENGEVCFELARGEKETKFHPFSWQPFGFQRAIALSNPSPWHQAQSFLAEIEDHLRLAPENGQYDTPLRLLVERMPATFKALRRAHEEQVRQVAERTAELSQANAVLKKQIAEIAQSQRRLAAEHAVARILAESASLTDAIPRILQNISQSLAWDVGLLWTLDRDFEVLRCMDVWHAPTVQVPASTVVTARKPSR